MAFPIDADAPPRISARMNERGEMIWAENLYSQYERPWELSMDPYFDEFVASLPIPSLSRTHLCPVESQFPLAQRMHRTDTAERIQALWRGYKVRKTLEEQKAAEIAAVLPLWKSLDEVYRIFVKCQSYANILNYNNPTWDATESPWYIWMLTQGRHIESIETYLFERGWVRPAEQPLNLKKAASAMKEVCRYYRPRSAPSLCLLSQLGIWN